MDLSLFPPFWEFLQSTEISLGLKCVTEEFSRAAATARCQLRHVSLVCTTATANRPLGRYEVYSPVNPSICLSPMPSSPMGSYFLLGVSAKHLREDVSTTVSQNVTTGSATWNNNNRFVRFSSTFFFFFKETKTFEHLKEKTGSSASVLISIVYKPLRSAQAALLFLHLNKTGTFKPNSRYEEFSSVYLFDASQATAEVQENAGTWSYTPLQANFQALNHTSVTESCCKSYFCILTALFFSLLNGHDKIHAVYSARFIFPSFWDRGTKPLPQLGKSLSHFLTLISISEYIFRRSCITQSR